MLERHQDSNDDRSFAPPPRFQTTYASSSSSKKKRDEDSEEAVVDLRRIAIIMLNLGGHPLECTRSHLENIIWDGNQDGHSVVDVFESTTSGRKSIAADVDADGKVCFFQKQSCEKLICNYYLA